LLVLTFWRDLISAGVAVLERRVVELSRRLASGTVCVELRHRAMGTATAPEVAALRPWTMSW
jgi:hypothetical protein